MPLRISDIIQCVTRTSDTDLASVFVTGKLLLIDNWHEEGESQRA